MGRPQQKYFPLTGGLDQVTPPIKVEPGKLLSVSNYEQGILGGYTRIEGFERTDGQPLPSAMSYWILNFDTGGPTELVDDMRLVGRTSGATGVILDVSLTSGSWAGGDAAGFLVLYKVTGSFQDDEVIAVSGADDSFNVGFSGGFA